MREVQAAKHIPEDPAVGVAIVLVIPGVPERIRLIPQRGGFPRGEVSADVVHGDHRLHQDVLAEDAVFGIAAGIIREPAVHLLERQPDIFTDVEPVQVECGVDANGAALVPVIRGRSVLPEEIERDVVRVVFAAA